MWQGASQGDWDVAANWSLGHAPTAGECAVLPDTGSSYAIAVNGEFLIGALQLAPRAGDGVTAVTLTGIGFLTNDVKVADHVVGANRRLVLDGASICFQYESETAETNGQIAVDGEVAVVDDASRLSAYALNLVGDGAKLSLTAGSVQLIHTTYSGANAIQIDGGTYSSYRIGPPAVEGGGNPSAADCRITYLQNGGDVQPEFRDTVGDEVRRDFTAHGTKAGRYVDMSGRNDIVAAKVSRNGNDICFYVRTREPMTAPGGQDWMKLFIDADRSAATGWLGYDFMVERAMAERGGRHVGRTVLRMHEPGKRTGMFSWSAPLAEVSAAWSGKEMEIAVPASAFRGRLRSDGFDFKWEDHSLQSYDWTDFTLHGDAAPNDRYNFRVLF